MEDSGKDNGALQRQLAELRRRVSDLEAAEKVWKHTEQALKEERDFNATVLNTVDALVNVLDYNGRIVGFNRACQECTGYSFEEVEGRIFWDFLLPPEEMDPVKDVFKRLQSVEPENRFVNHWLTRDGRKRLIEWSNSTLRDSTGSIKYIMSTGIDITERKRAEETLKFNADFERLITSISARFINLRAGEIDDGVHNAMREVGLFTQVDRCNLFLFSEDLAEARSKVEWSREGIEPFQYSLTSVPTTPYRWVIDKLKTGEVVSIPSVADISDEDPLKDLLKLRGFQAWLIVPIFQRRSLIGFLALGNVTAERDWPGGMITSTKILAQIVANLYERQEMEDTLRQSEEKFRELLENGSDLISVVDAEGIIRYESPSIKRLLGYEPHEVNGRDVWQFIHPEDTDQIRDIFEKTRELSGSTVELEYRILHKDRSWRIFEAAGKNLIDHPAIGGFVFNSRDVTEHKKAEEALRYRERFENIIATISTNFIDLPVEEIDSGIIAALETIGRFAGMDRSYVFLFSEKGMMMSCKYEWCTPGIEPQIEYFQNIDIHSSFPWFAKRINNFEAVNVPRVADLPDQAKAEREGFQRQGIQSIIDVPMISAGSIFGFLGFETVQRETTWSEDIVKLLRISGEMLVNILERKRSEEELRKSEARLIEAQQIAHIGNWDWDIVKNTLYWSDEIYRLFGLKPQEFGATYDAFLESVHPEDLELVERSVNDALNEKKPYSIDHRIVLPDGSERTVHERAEVTFSEDGQATRMIGTVQDVTERKRIEEALQYRERFEKIIATISTNFIDLPAEEIDSGITAALETIGKFAGMDRSYVFLFSEKGMMMSCKYKWCAPGIEPQIEYLQNIDIHSSFSWFAEKIKNFEAVNVPRVVDLPGEAKAEREEFQRQGIQSIINVPMISAGSIFGFLGFETVQRETTWSEDIIVLLKIVGEMFVNVLERKQTEKMLSESESKYRTMIDKMPFACFTFDRKGRILSWNRGCEQIYGYTREEAVGASSYDLIVTANTRAATDEVIGKVFNGETLLGSEWQDRNKSGELGYRFGNTFPLFRTDGTIECGVNLNVDITERKHAEMMLTESETKYRTLFETAGDGINLMGEEIFIDCNARTLTLFGCTREQFIGQPPYRFSPPKQPDGRDSKEKAREKIAAALDGRPQFFEWRHTRLDGTPFDTEVTLNMLKLPDGVFLQAVVRDITKRKQTESKLRDSEKKYRFLFEQTPAITAIIDSNIAIRDVNRALLKMLNFSKDELKGRMIYDMVVPDQRESVRSELEKSINRGFMPETEVDIVAKDGSLHTMLFPAGEIVKVNEADQLEGILIHGIDITVRKRAQDLTKKQEEQLFQAAKMASLGTLISGFAHEVNNPNNFMRLNAQGLEDFWGDIEEFLDGAFADSKELSFKGIAYPSAKGMIREMIKGIQNGSRRIENLIKDLKDYVREEKGELNQTVDMNRVVEGALALVKSEIRKSTDRFTLQLAENIPQVRGNSHQLEQIVINLVTNACEALETKDRGIEVSTEYVKDFGLVSVKVRDEGVGIPAENISQIMDPLFTTKREKGGTGLGLSVSQRIAREHGGDLLFTSEPGRGTVAYLHLPVPDREKILRGGSMNHG